MRRHSTELRCREFKVRSPSRSAARQRRGLSRGRRDRLEAARNLAPSAVAPPAVIARLAANVAAVGVAVGEDARRIIRCLGEPNLGSALESTRRNSMRRLSWRRRRARRGGGRGGVSSARPLPPCACHEVVRASHLRASPCPVPPPARPAPGARQNVKAGPLVLRDGNLCGCVYVFLSS